MGDKQLRLTEALVIVMAAVAVRHLDGTITGPSKGLAEYHTPAQGGLPADGGGGGHSIAPRCLVIGRLVPGITGTTGRGA
jgi:hypothetical protein